MIFIIFIRWEVSKIEQEKNFEKRNWDEKGLHLPKVHIESKGCVTKINVDGVELNGVRKISFLHNRGRDAYPVLRIKLLAEQICLETAQIFALPEVYHPYYVSSDKLVKLGILTHSKLNELLNKKLL